MLVGHYGVALAGRRCRQSQPLWAFAAATQLLDIVWCVLILAGVEHFAPAPGLPGSPLIFTHYPWSHSLPAALAWSVLTWLLTRKHFGARGAWLLALVVFSHWPLDLLVHRPDLLLWPGGPRVGLGLWDHPLLERALEVFIVAAGALWWSLCPRLEGRSPWRAIIFAGVLVLLFLAAGSGQPASPVVIGSMGLGFYLFAIVLAWFVDRPRRAANASQ